MVFLVLSVHERTRKIKSREEGKEGSHMAAIIILNKKDGSWEKNWREECCWTEQSMQQQHYPALNSLIKFLEHQQDSIFHAENIDG